LTVATIEDSDTIFSASFPVDDDVGRMAERGASMGVARRCSMTIELTLRVGKRVNNEP